MKYLAYGANMDIETMKQRCPESEFLGTGILDDWRLMFKGEMPSSYATIEQWQGFSVPFVLWEITQADERKLDRYEGYPRHYKKSVVMIDFCGEKISAMYYHKPEKLPTNPPILHYLDALAQSYEFHGFDKKILKAAFEFSDFKPWH